MSSSLVGKSGCVPEDHLHLHGQLCAFQFVLRPLGVGRSEVEVNVAQGITRNACLQKRKNTNIVTYTLVVKGPPVIVGADPRAIKRRTRPVLARTPLRSVSNRVVVTAPMSAAATTVLAATILIGDWLEPTPGPEHNVESV